MVYFGTHLNMQRDYRMHILINKQIQNNLFAIIFENILTKCLHIQKHVVHLQCHKTTILSKTTNNYLQHVTHHPAEIQA